MKGVIAALVLAARGVLCDPLGSVEVGLQECIDAANVMRTAKLDLSVPVLQRDSSLEAAAKQILDSAFQTHYDCATLKAPNLAQGPDDVVGLAFDSRGPQCLEGMAESANRLLNLSENFPPPYNESVAPWNDGEAQVAARFLLASATGMGCAFTKGCTTNYAICKLSAMPVKGEQPFSEGFYSALQARKAAGIDIINLGASDIGTPLGSGASAASISVLFAASLVFPSVVLFIF